MCERHKKLSSSSFVAAFHFSHQAQHYNLDMFMYIIERVRAYTGRSAEHSRGVLINLRADAETLNGTEGSVVGGEHAQQKVFGQNVQQFADVYVVLVHLVGCNFEQLFSLRANITYGILREMFYALCII